MRRQVERPVWQIGIFLALSIVGHTAKNEPAVSKPRQRPPRLGNNRSILSLSSSFPHYYICSFFPYFFYSCRRRRRYCHRVSFQFPLLLIFFFLSTLLRIHRSRTLLGQNNRLADNLREQKNWIKKKKTFGYNSIAERNIVVLWRHSRQRVRIETITQASSFTCHLQHSRIPASPAGNNNSFFIHRFLFSFIFFTRAFIFGRPNNLFSAFPRRDYEASRHLAPCPLNGQQNTLFWKPAMFSLENSETFATLANA